MYKSIQCLRALAALLVVLFHLSIAVSSAKYFGITPLANVFQFGDSGVPFFFVLSGFIITSVHAKDFGHPERLLGYLRKRAARIYPTYFIIFALTCAAVWMLLPEARAAIPSDPVILIKSLALLPQDKMASGGTGAPVLIVAWTLQYEICFYALVALLILSRTIGLAVMALLAVNFVGCHAGSCTFPQSFFANNLFLLFGLGVLIAYGARSRLRLPRPRLIATAAAGLFLSYALLETLLGRESFAADRRLVYGGLSGVLLFALVQAEDAGQLTIRNRWFLLLGDASYALYLIHYPLISALCKLLRELGLMGTVGAAIAFFVILLACMSIAAAFHILVERPLLRTLSSPPSGRARIKTSPDTMTCRALDP